MCAIPFVFTRPWLGVLFWTWLAFLNPHRLVWGFARSIPFSMIVGIVTLGAFLAKGEKKFPVTPVSVLAIMFTLYTCFTTLFAIFPDDALWKWDRFMKIMIMTFVAMCMINDRFRLQALIWTMVLSLGYYGIRGGVFTVVTGGNYRVWGPTESFIADNNQLALALIMLLPLVRYLHIQTKNKWIRLALLGGMGLLLISIIGSYSRGAFLALACTGMYFWWKSKRKVTIAFLVVAAMSAILSFMPDAWHERMDTIETAAEQDRSAQQRLDSWIFAIEIAKARPITGGGFGVFGNETITKRYFPETTSWRSAHSVYFEVMGEHGMVGFVLFMTVLAATIMSCNLTRRRVRQHEELKWMADLMTMCQVSMIGYMAAGAFLNLATFDLMWMIVAITAICNLMSKQMIAEGVQGHPANRIWNPMPWAKESPPDAGPIIPGMGHQPRPGFAHAAAASAAHPASAHGHAAHAHRQTGHAHARHAQAGHAQSGHRHTVKGQSGHVHSGKGSSGHLQSGQSRPAHRDAGQGAGVQDQKGRGSFLTKNRPKPPKDTAKEKPHRRPRQGGASGFLITRR